MKKIFSRVSLQLPSGKTVYPTRGIGLGYYEDLKTLGIAAILLPWKDRIVSLYGDQGLVSLANANFKLFKSVINEMRDYGFIIKDSKTDTKTGVVKWSGWTMGDRRLNERVGKRCRVSSSFLTIFDGEYHWERKNRVVGFYNQHPKYRDRMERFPYDYECLFGYEFSKGDSFNSYLQCGVAPHTLREVGDTRFYKVERLNTPKDLIRDNILYSTPFFMEWERLTSRHFSKYRKKVYRNTKGSSFVFEYINPRIELKKTVKPVLSPLQKVVSEREDLHMIATIGLTTGRFFYGLDPSSCEKALRVCSLAPNPFEAYATGGYRVSTNWHHPRRVSAEWLYCYKVLHHSVSKLEAEFSSYYSDIQREKDKPSYSALVTKKRKIPFPSWGNQSKNPNLSKEERSVASFKISFDEVRFKETSNYEDSMEVVGATDLFSDLQNYDFGDRVYPSEGEDENLESLEGDFEYEDEEMF